MEEIGRGKWALPGVPHRGWKCVDFEDLDEPSETCEMCESAEIRYVHVMQHRDYKKPLRCGCICAGNMEQDYAAAQERERKAHSRSSRRANWLRREWKLSQKGNWWLNTDGFNITVFQRDGFWHGRIAHRETGRTFWSELEYVTEESCKLAALDAMLSIKDEF